MHKVYTNPVHRAWIGSGSRRGYSLRMPHKPTKRPQRRSLQDHTAEGVGAHRRALDALLCLAAIATIGLIACVLLDKSPADVKEICLLLIRVVVEIAARR